MEGKGAELPGDIILYESAQNTHIAVLLWGTKKKKKKKKKILFSGIRRCKKAQKSIKACRSVNVQYSI